MTDYLKYRGKCKELCEELVAQNSVLTLVRGYYLDAFWGEQPHWWCKDENNNIIDPSKKQFPDQNGDYVEFDGFHECSQCGNPVEESEATFAGNYVFCSGECYMRCVI